MVHPCREALCRHVRSSLHDDLVRHIALQLLVRQADAVLHAHLIANAAFLAQDCDALDFHAVLDDRSAMARVWRGRAFDACPGSDTTVPADDRVQHTGVVFDLRFIQDDCFFDTSSCADDGFGTDGDVRT